MASRGLIGVSSVLSATVVDGEGEIAARLSLPLGTKMVKIERLRQGEDEPFAVETVYLSAEQFANLTRSPLERGSLFGMLEREYGVALAHADEEIDATAADPRTAELLSVPRGAPLLRIRQVIFSTSGKATIYVLGFYRSDRHTLHIRRFR
jgi:GntR family transcriptional regulator